MKRIVFVSIVSCAVTAAACGLVIDPDQLIADNGTDGGAATTGIDAGGGTRSDAGFDADVPTGVSGCVPKAPTGTEGPYALVSTGFVSFLACPPGYRTSPVVKGSSGAQVKSAKCDDASGCSCDPPSGTPTCGLRIRYFDDFQCNEEKGSPDSLSASCREVKNESHFRVESVVNGMTCAAKGQATPTSKPAVTFSSESWVCEADPSFPRGSCSSDEVSLPATATASACVILRSGSSCPEPYARERTLSKDGAVIDQRGCACTCAIDGAAACDGGSATSYLDSDCTTFPQSVTIGACRPMSTIDSMKGTPGTPSGTPPTCIPAASPTGTATPANDLKLCCLR